MEELKEKKTIEKLKHAFEEIALFFPKGKLRDEFIECCFLAGGCVYSTYNEQQPNDYDIFCTNESVVLKLKSYLKETGDYEIITEHAVTFNVGDKKCQLVTKWHGEVEAVIDQFDFKHNMFAYKNNKIYCGIDSSYLDTKFLRFNFKRARDIASSITRVPKFVARGFICTRREMARMLERLTDEEVLSDEIESIKELIGGHGY